MSHGGAQLDQLSERVRSSCRTFLERAEHVRLLDDGLDRLATQIDRVPAAEPRVESDEVVQEGRLLQSFAVNAINFGSGYHDLVRKLPGLSGARTMNTRLLHYFDATGPPTAARLARFTVADCSQIFGQELDGGAVEELMSLFASALNDLGHFIDTNGGSAQAVLEGVDHSSQTLADLLTVMPYYRDVETVDGVEVQFYKRAQITPADLAREGLWRFDDLHLLTAFADNLVPHVLRIDGAIEVDQDLVAMIGRGQRLEPGSRPEVELRAAAVVAVEELVGRVEHPSVWAMHVDEWLWLRGGGATYKAQPRPRSRSVFY